MQGIRRPEARVLASSALVPAQNVIARPDRFSHVLARRQGFYYAEPPAGKEPDGYWERGTPVLLLTHIDAEYCRVACASGLAAVLVSDALAPVRF